MTGPALKHGAAAKTLIHCLVHERHLTREQAIEMLERRARSMDIGDFAVSLRQMDRWFGGRVATTPRPSVCRVLEAEFGYPVAELLSPDSRSSTKTSADPGFRTSQQARMSGVPSDDISIATELSLLRSPAASTNRGCGWRTPRCWPSTIGYPPSPWPSKT